MTAPSSFAEPSDADVLVADSQLCAPARRVLRQRVGELVTVDPALSTDQAGQLRQLTCALNGSGLP